MAKEAVVGIAKDEKGNVVIGKKKLKEEKWFSGKWHIPGETKELEESDLSALVRGLNEELGIEIDVNSVKYLAKHISPTGMNVNWYECTATSTALKVGSDLDDAKWVPSSLVAKECDQESVALWPIAIKKYFGLID